MLCPTFSFHYLTPYNALFIPHPSWYRILKDTYIDASRELRAQLHLPLVRIKAAWRELKGKGANTMLEGPCNALTSYITFIVHFIDPRHVVSVGATFMRYYLHIIDMTCCSPTSLSNTCLHALRSSVQDLRRMWRRAWRQAGRAATNAWLQAVGEDSRICSGNLLRSWSMVRNEPFLHDTIVSTSCVVISAGVICVHNNDLMSP